jgi:hypothetical protein
MQKLRVRLNIVFDNDVAFHDMWPQLTVLARPLLLVA